MCTTSNEQCYTNSSAFSGDEDCCELSVCQRGTYIVLATGVVLQAIKAVEMTIALKKEVYAAKIDKAATLVRYF